jgi:ATP synthase j chain
MRHRRPVARAAHQKLIVQGPPTTHRGIPVTLIRRLWPGAPPCPSHPEPHHPQPSPRTMPTDGNPSPPHLAPKADAVVAAGHVYNNRTPNTWLPKKFAGLRYYDTPIFRPLWPFFVGGRNPVMDGKAMLTVVGITFYAVWNLQTVMENSPAYYNDPRHPRCKPPPRAPPPLESFFALRCLGQWIVSTCAN